MKGMTVMKKEERKTELLVIANHLAMVTEDLCNYRDRLEAAKCKRESDMLDTITGKLYNLQWIISDKARGYANATEEKRPV